jgi:undecaprenyl-diphosphatase
MGAPGLAARSDGARIIATMVHRFSNRAGAVRAFGARVVSWFAAREVETLAALLIAAGAVWLFAELADDVLEGDTTTVDERVLLLLRTPNDTADPIGPPWLEDLVRDLTSLGGVAVLAMLTLASAGFLVLQRKSALAAYLLAAVAGGTVVSTLLKLGFDRDRPSADLVAHGQIVYTSSFPSGHSMLSAVVYLTLGALLASAQENLRLRAYVIALAVFLAVLVGASRVYLGVHWPTDVVAGWTAGAAWALLCWALAERVRRPRAAVH